MTATHQASGGVHPRRLTDGPRPAGFNPAARLVAVVLAAALWMHGCHGPDDDHEPVFAPPPREVAP